MIQKLMSHGYGPLVIEVGGEGKGEELTGGLAHLPVALWMSIFYDNVYSESCMNDIIKLYNYIWQVHLKQLVTSIVSQHHNLFNYHGCLHSH